MRYPVVLEKTDGGYVSRPALSGCIAEGRSEQEALENIKIAIQEYLSVFLEIRQKPGFDGWGL